MSNQPEPEKSPAAPRLPRVLFCVDAPMWAHDFKSTNIIKYLSPRFDFRKRYHKDLVREDFEWADVIVIYYWKQLIELAKFMELFPKKITLGGISCPTDMEHDTREIAIKLLKMFSSVFVHNQFLYEEYKSQFSQPFYLNENGVDTVFYTPASERPPGTPLVVGWAGSLSNHGPNKRGYHDIIVPAVGRVPGVVLHTAAREEKWRGPDEMLEFYRSLDVYLVASRVEGTPNPGLESAACGIPVISTRVGNMPELIRDGENGFLVERTPEAFAEKLMYLRDHLDVRNRLGDQMRKDIMSWDWSIKAQGYDRMISESLDRAGWKPEKT